MNEYVKHDGNVAQIMILAAIRDFGKLGDFYMDLKNYGCCIEQDDCSSVHQL